MQIGNKWLAIIVSLFTYCGAAQADNRIIHDGEFEFLRLQNGERWDAEDKEIDKMLAVKEAELMEI